MIKRIETMKDVKAVLDFAPELEDCFLFDDVFGLFNNDKNSLGSFYDDEKKDVFNVWKVYGQNDDITFFMMQSLRYEADVKVLDWCYGKEETNDVYISFITRNK